MSPRNQSQATVAEYLAFEETAPERHEYHDGEILAMSGGSFRHAKIASNLSLALGRRLDGGPCSFLGSDLKVGVMETNRFFHPDGTVLCEPPAFHPDDSRSSTLINPRVVFEVLSESTEAYDRGDKFNHYRRLSSIREYVLLSQKRPAVESFLRQPDGAWSLLTFEGLDIAAALRSLDLEVPLAEIYAGIDFSLE